MTAVKKRKEKLLIRAVHFNGCGPKSIFYAH